MTEPTDTPNPLDLVVAMAHAHGDLVTIGYDPRRGDWVFSHYRTQPRGPSEERKVRGASGSTPVGAAMAALADARRWWDKQAQDAADGLGKVEAERQKFEDALTSHLGTVVLADG